jgi:alkaline phosphatase D
VTRAGRAVAHGVGEKPDEVDAAPSDVPEDTHAFFLGVAAGDAHATDTMLWTRYDGDDLLRLVVWQEQDGKWRQVVRHDAPLLTRGAVHVPVTELVPAHEFRYAFYRIKDGAAIGRSRVGRFRTAPAADALTPITIGATCCTMNGRDQGALLQAGKRRDLDALVVLGDTVYADGCQSLPEFRKRWWDNLDKPGWQALRASTSVISTWDDHEVDNDWRPETVDSDKLTAAKAAFFEHVPMCRSDECPERIWRKVSFGKTVDVFVLDVRGERRCQCSPPEYISRAQMDWLKDGLKRSGAMFKVIVNTVPISRFPPIFAGTRNDRWEMFPAQRDEILSFTESGAVSGAVWLSGDFHLAMIARASATGLGSKSLEVLAGPGAQFGHPLTPWLFGRQYDWASAENNVATLRFDPSQKRLTVSQWGMHGEKLHEASYRKKAIGFERVEDWLL